SRASVARALDGLLTSLSQMPRATQRLGLLVRPDAFVLLRERGGRSEHRAQPERDGEEDGSGVARDVPLGLGHRSNNIRDLASSARVVQRPKQWGFGRFTPSASIVNGFSQSPADD